MKCLHCSRELNSRFSKKFCGNSCSATFNNLLKGKRKTVVCFHCESKFETQQHIKRTKYWCGKCKKKTISANKPINEKNCNICNQPFISKFNKKHCDLCWNNRKNKYFKRCNNCGTDYLANKSNSKFCSGSCRSIKLKLHLNAHTRSGLSRSSVEKIMEERLLSDFNNINFLFNDIDTIGSELDIFIKDFKIAIELNGIFHYKPIYGHKTLDRIQKNDTKKRLLCEENGIKLYSINIGQKRASKKNLEIIYNQIKDIIKNGQ